MTHWLNHSLVLASDYRVPDPERVWPLLERRQDGLAELGAHHVLVYTSTTDPGRVLVLIAIHTKETVIELLRSQIFFEWFDAVGVEDIPAVFAGELVERLELSAESLPSAPEVMVSVVTTVENVTNLITHVRETADDLRAAGVRRLLIFDAFDNAREVMMLFQIDDENHARHWLRDSELSTEWMGKAGMGAYPPVFVGKLQSMLRVDEADQTDDG
ncbi:MULTISPECIES: fatty-acid--CoA ligase [unclassified Mycobacterium]|uniref:fatty-acid--CoA ligase n=1 Tax=unclassified Mycobacterium TaxID=2642494 RepID=UPI0029C77816|nr:MULTISPECIES: fatty-acid--CoA ligase [unclassified Mycobacterium]